MRPLAFAKTLYEDLYRYLFGSRRDAKKAEAAAKAKQAAIAELKRRYGDNVTYGFSRSGAADLSTTYVSYD